MKLVLSDLDGTLLPSTENRISDNTMQAIARLCKNNMAFAIASGRALSELWRLFDKVRDEMYFVACDGALIFKGEQLLFDAPMQNLAQFDRAETVLLQGKYITYVKGHNSFVREMKLHYGGHAVEFEKTEEINEPIYKVVVVAKDFAAEGVNTVYADMRLSEFTAKGIDKGSATRFLMQHLSIDKSQAAAFGDNLNDIPMLTAVEHSYAVRNAKQAVRKVCKATTDYIVKTLMELK